MKDEVRGNWDLRKRTEQFALDCIRLVEMIPQTIAGKHIGGQLLRASTSVAANYRASRLAQSKAGFIAKQSIVIEEADESEFWLDMLCKSKIFETEETARLKNEAHEIASIFISSRRTAQQNKR